ncbi:MAG: family 43 glycosylhydrolase [Mycetocola sp.]
MTSHAPSRHRRRTIGLATAFVVAATLAIPSTGSLSPAQAAPDAVVPTDGLLADYRFDQTSGTTITNHGSGADATVVNGQNSQWTGSSLRFVGGAKTSATANWVRLPERLLGTANSATISTEVKFTAAMKRDYNFLWSIGSDSTNAYYFTSVRDNARTAITTRSNSGESNAASPSALTADRWYSLTSVIDGDAKTLSFYVDGVKVGSTPTQLTPASITDQSINAIGRSPWPDGFFAGEVSAFRVYDRALSDEQVDAINTTDATINTASLESLATGLLDSITLTDGDVTGEVVSLPTQRGAVSWESSNPAVISTTGRVTQPEQGEAAVPVTLTATATVRGVAQNRSYTLNVQPSTKSEQQRAEEAAALYVVPPTLTSGAELPEAPEGLNVALSNPQNATLDGRALSTDADKAVTATVDATIARSSHPDSTVTKTFTITLLPEQESAQLLSYNRTPTTDQEANNADVAYSMHLALDADGGWSPLNENYGIFFPTTSQTVPAGGTSSGILRSLKDPSVFTLANGEYGVVATRLARGGGSDGTEAHSVVLATSPDLRSYTEHALLRLDETGGVNSPTAVYDSAAELYRVSWTNDSGVDKTQAFTSLTDETAPVGRAAAGAAQLGRATGSTPVAEASDIPNYAAGTQLSVPSSIAAGLDQRFGRITNTGYTPFDTVTLDRGEELNTDELPTRVNLEYSDGSTGTLPVTEWDTSDVDVSTPGEYQITGEVTQTTYPTPFADERADPSVYKFDWNGTTKYLMIATNDLYGDNVVQQSQAFMPVRMADSISGLSDEAGAAEVKLLKRGDTDALGRTITGCFWAPEFHEINGRLSILFMPCYSNNPDMWTGRASIIQLNQDADGNDLDPSDPASWTKAQEVVRADGSALNQLAGISLDMTFFQDEAGQSYYSWQQLGANFIARVDPANPTRLTSEPVRIVVPEYAWDNTIAEGPNVLNHNGTFYMIYSGSTVGDTYTTGLVMADASGDTDLTDPASWTKLNYPVQKSGLFNGEWQLGTGHGMWSEDEHGNLIYVFHARTDNNGLSGRDMFVRRVHFDAEDIPVFDMELDEELAEPTVTATVVVADDADTDADADSSGSDADAEGNADGSDAGSDGSGASSDANAAGSDAAADGAGTDANAAAVGAADGGASESDADGSTGSGSAGVTGTGSSTGSGSDADSDSAKPGTRPSADGSLAQSGAQIGGFAALAALLLGAGALLLIRRRRAAATPAGLEEHTPSE